MTKGLIKWMGGMTTITKESIWSGNILMQGYRLNNGEFRETSRITFTNADDANTAKMEKNQGTFPNVPGLTPRTELDQ